MSMNTEASPEGCDEQAKLKSELEVRRAQHVVALADIRVRMMIFGERTELPPPGLRSDFQYPSQTRA